MVTIITILAACILFLISLLHVFWAFGGTWGKNVVLPEEQGNRAFSPSVGGTLLVALLLSMAGGILLIEANHISLPEKYLIVQIGAWVCAVVFALRVLGDFNYFGIGKKKRNTKFSKMDTYLYIPLCAFLSVAFIVAINCGG
ncbi:DUF3995 domain-containing protein [Sporosarcina limicola]|uniref:DUF3995 domain-containing protein n=1 Tax=Sporosarcina limicola TaxID=34101 RepID=A0A927MM70_9BACL|nr:DUF3995 domain-containing protein [Sporosarcina limicola]MBE1557153.1 hypothetical protein [Sporosarcina limicola]